MLEKNHLSHHIILDCLKKSYGIELTTLTFLPLGADQNASVFKGVTQSLASYFIKIKRGHQHDIGIAIVELLHQEGILPVIPPINTMDGQSTHRIEDFTLVVYPYMDGEDGFHRPLTDQQWEILGKTLRQVHEIALPPSIQNSLRREDYSPKWRDSVRSFYSAIESEPSGDEFAQRLLAFMKMNFRSIQKLVNRSEQLAEQIQNEPTEFVLCHSDLHAGNVLIGENNAIHIVDWDDPIIAPKERDLMFIGGGVGNVWNQPQETSHFYKGYGKVDIHPFILSYYRHERIVEDIAEYCDDLLLTAGGENRPAMLQHFIDMFAPMGVVDIAFKTEES